MNKFLQFITSMNQMTQMALITIVLIIAAYSFGSCGKQSEMDKYITEYKKYQKEVIVLKHTADSLDKIARAHADSAKKDSVKADKQTKEIDNLKGKLGNTQEAKSKLQREIDSLKINAPDTSKISLKKDTIIALLRVDSANLQSTIVKLEQRDTTRVNEISKWKNSFNIETIRAGKLQAKLDSLKPPPKDPGKWFFGLLPKPNRVTTGLIAFGVGVVAGNRLTIK